MASVPLQAHGAARQALSALDERGLAPTPENYRLWYDHFAGANEELSAALERLLASGEPLDDHRCRLLYERFFAPGLEPRSLLDTGRRLQDLLQRLQAEVAAAGRETAEYGSFLGAARSEMAERVPGPRIDGLLGDLMRETTRMQTMALELERDLVTSSSQIAELRHSLREAQTAALTDPLTGLANRKHFELAAVALASRASADSEPVCLALADVDHFKDFNDHHGHLLGDQALRLVADMLRRNVKGQDLVARYGGEEFAVILPSTRLADACRLADRLREVISARRLKNKQSGLTLGRITMSVGVSELRPGDTLERWVARADGALYEAKRLGRDRVEAAPAEETGSLEDRGGRPQAPVRRSALRGANIATDRATQGAD
ncbi:GGDEF domain-containing protein [Geminicoccaceae bacterium 1502E]|nr:GGDEF domain-containing protein [Geminicoccaceae bacterium 1502E]